MLPITFHFAMQNEGTRLASRAYEIAVLAPEPGSRHGFSVDLQLEDVGARIMPCDVERAARPARILYIYLAKQDGFFPAQWSGGGTGKGLDDHGIPGIDPLLLIGEHLLAAGEIRRNVICL